MFSESDLIQYPSTESSSNSTPDRSSKPAIQSLPTDALMPELFFAPPPQHTDAPSPESFDQEVAELDLDLLFEQFDFLPTFYDTIPVISDPSALTYSTESVQEVTSSHYSSDFTQSDYPVPSEIENHYSSNNGLSGTHDFIDSDVFSNGPPSTQPLHPAEAQFDSGTSDLSPNFVGISPEDSSISAPVPFSVPLLSTAMQPPTSVVPAPLPVHVTPDSEAHTMAPAPDRQFKCPLCPRTSKRRHNLKTHIGTHYKLKPFECSTCGCRFSRKNDLDRHCRNPTIHLKQMSMSSISGRRFDPNPDLPHRITVNGDPRLTTSTNPDPIM
ncbi:hypothetical protein F5888DRAFT_1909823 [Russula emetica]|nr:hypothetical protein F5888DRAFT_1909823 [Russula emetica]